MIRDALRSDQSAIAGLYAYNHPEASTLFCFSLGPNEHGFVALDSSGVLIGFALVHYCDYGAESHGVIHQLEVTRALLGPERWQISDALIDACVEWVNGRGSNLVYAREVDKTTRTMAMLRYTRSRKWVIDPATGLYNDVGPAESPEPDIRTGPPWKGMQKPDVWN